MSSGNHCPNHVNGNGSTTHGSANEISHKRKLEKEQKVQDAIGTCESEVTQSWLTVVYSTRSGIAPIELRRMAGLFQERKEQAEAKMARSKGSACREVQVQDILGCR